MTVDWCCILFESKRCLRHGALTEPVLEDVREGVFFNEATVSAFMLDVDGCFVEILLTASASVI
jgi:hypothetical protein